MSIRFRILSDIHLECFNKNKLINVTFEILNLQKCDKVDYLILAGDITNYDQIDKNFKYFLDNITSDEFQPKYKKIFYILGNHEYYGVYNYNKTPEDIIEAYSNFLKNYENIVFLENQKYIINKNDDCNINILGSTLWSKCDEEGYKMINDKFFISFENFLRKNQESVEFLENEISSLKNDKCESKNSKTVIITHHLPSYSTIDKKFINMNGTAFANHLDYLFDDINGLWIHGHSHEKCIKYVNNLKIVRNPLGYPSENSNMKTNENFYLFDMIIDI